MECSMCGDVGFADHLFQCSKCHFRFQHRYCSRGYFYGDHIELCDWCIVESDLSGGCTANFHSSNKPEPTLRKKRDVASAFSLKRKRDEAGLTVKCNDRKANVAAGLMRSVSKRKVRNTRLVPPRSRQRTKLLRDILC